MKIPKLQQSKRSREYNACEEEVRDKIILTHIYLNENIIISV